MTRMSRLLIVCGLLLAVGALGACKSGPDTRADVWPTVDALPESPPESLNTDAPGTILRTATDGFVYAVGLTEDAEPGTLFLARYSGEWPIPDLPRPAMAVGRLVRTYDNGVGLVHLTYELPGAELDGLEVTWEEQPISEHLGKGRARVASLDSDPPTAVELSIGSDHGVREGDFYAIFKEPLASESKEDVEPRMLQLSRRLTGVCMVKKVADDSATCTLWRGSTEHPNIPAPKQGQEVALLEHTFGSAPREAVIQIAAVKGGDEAIQQKITGAMRAYVKTMPSPHTTVEPLDTALEATATDFYQEADRLTPLAKPQLVIGSEIVERDGKKHLILNYTGVGPAAGPGMVAAPPEGGVDAGPIDNLDKQTLSNMSATVYAGLLVYRGQTSEALLQLHQMLDDPDLDGPLRWHARDQYAMRWGAIGNYREALWLVLQDEKIAADKNDRDAWLNALGTRVRLYDFLELPAQAVSSARRYLDAREEEKPGPTWRAALAMYGEMLMADGRVDDALEVVEQLEEACPEGCKGDLNGHLAGVFWNVPEDRQEIRDRLMGVLLEHADSGGPSTVAAARLYQGLMAMRDEEYSQALVAFRESERLYAKVENLNGQARAKYFAFLAEMSAGNPQQAFDTAREAQKIEMELNDFDDTAQIFERMTALYTNPDFLEKPGPFLGAANQILGGAVESQIAQGDFGSASESLLAMGGFLLRIGQGAQAKSILQEAVGYAISFKRFDVAALAHLYLGIIARQEGEMDTFRDEVQKAQTMGRLSEDPNVQRAIEEVLNPEKKEEPPTQLL